MACRALLFLVLALTALTFASPEAAHADFACGITGDDLHQTDHPGNNGEGLFPAVRQWEDQPRTDDEDLADMLNDGTVDGATRMPKSPQSYTLYELNGMRGLSWSMTFKGTGDASENNGEMGSGADDCDVMDWASNGGANIIFNGTKILTRAAISVKETASNPSPLSGLYGGRDSVVEALNKNLFKPAVPVVIMLTGFWVFTKWRKGDMREVWSGVAWSALTTIAVSAFLFGGNHSKVVEEADSGIAQANALLTEAVLSGITGQMQPPCDLPKGAHNRGMRVSSCAMYDTMAFRPWALGQFGADGTDCLIDDRPDGAKNACTPSSTGTKCAYGKGARCEDERIKHVVSQSITNKDHYLDDKPDKFKDEWVPLRKHIASDHPSDFFEEWAGRNSGNRLGTAIFSLVAALIVGLMVIVISVLTLLWHAITLILIILLPLVATLGIHPSQQKLLKGWLETFIHSFVLRAGFGVVLTVLLVLYQMILPAPISLGMQLLLLVLVTLAVAMMLKKLMAGSYTPKIEGAEDSLGIHDTAQVASAKMSAKAQSTGRTTGRVAGRVAAKPVKAGARAAWNKWGKRSSPSGEQKNVAGATPSEGAEEERPDTGERAEEPQPEAPDAAPAERVAARPRVSTGTSGAVPAQPHPRGTSEGRRPEGEGGHTGTATRPRATDPASEPRPGSPGPSSPGGPAPQAPSPATGAPARRPLPAPQTGGGGDGRSDGGGDGRDGRDGRVSSGS